MCVRSRLELLHRPWWAGRVVLKSEMTFTLVGLLQLRSSVSGCARGEFANKPFVINTLISSKYQTHKTVRMRTLNLLAHDCEDLSSVGFRKCWEVSTEQCSRGRGTRFWATICFTRTRKFIWVVESVRMPAFSWREGSWIILSQGSSLHLVFLALETHFAKTLLFTVAVLKNRGPQADMASDMLLYHYRLTINLAGLC